MKKVDYLHDILREQLQQAAGTANRDQSTDSYTGSSHTFYAVPVPVRRKIIRDLLRQESELSDTTCLQLVDKLFRGASHEEKTMGAYVLKYRVSARHGVTPEQLARWLPELVGWAEVDALCFNVFTADELLAEWSSWGQLLQQLACHANPNVRRAALVLLCGPVSRSDDQRIHGLAFTLVRQLASENDILITKAISWLLRCQIDTNKHAVVNFLQTHTEALPRFVTREVERKLRTGKKNR